MQESSIGSDTEQDSHSPPWPCSHVAASAATPHLLREFRSLRVVCTEQAAAYFRPPITTSRYSDHNTEL